jgi:hypothetical protein
LPFATPGQYFVLFKNAQGETLNRVEFTITGTGNVSRSIEKNADLHLQLDKQEYQPGDTLGLHIVAPFHGAGLITIEQDGLVTSQWFKTQTTASDYRIKLPQDISGNAYVSVAFVRALDSREIYTSPLSYGVAAFTIAKQARTQAIRLNLPPKVQPGSNLTVDYHVETAGKLVLYAVDEGILQFAHYRKPEPLDYFFRKRALGVKTHQILDLLLPDYALVQNLSAMGGDGDSELYGKYKNPFAVKHKPPVAFWSGLLDVKAGDHQLSIPIPDYFSGTVRVYAVAADANKLGTATAETLASPDFVIQPQQPYAVAPGDEFDMGVLIANTSGLSGTQDLKVSVAADAGVEILSANPETLSLAPGQDGAVRFHARAKAQLGAAELHYQVKGGDKVATYNEALSIRPSQPLLTSLQAGVLTIEQQKQGQSKQVGLQRDLYPEQRQAEVAVAMTPAGYLRGIVDYLKHYPYGCTEQITSQAFPAAVLGGNDELGLPQETVAKSLARSIHILQTRQRHDGSFGYWTVADEGDAYYSLYATHFLLEAEERGFAVPPAMLAQALVFADNFSQERQLEARRNDARAYALYLLARKGNAIAARLHEVETEVPEGSVGRLFLAAAYKLQHLDADSARLFGEFPRDWQAKGYGLGRVEALSLYLYLVGKHAPELLTQNGGMDGYFSELAQDLVKRRVNSFQGSMALLGLSNLWARFAEAPANSLSVTTGKPPQALLLQGRTIKSAGLAQDTGTLTIQGEGQWNLYYQISERGYDRNAPKQAISQQLTINQQLLNAQGAAISELGLKDKLHVRIALHPDHAMQDIAVVLLLPGGFEVDLDESQGLAARKSLPVGDKPLWQTDYIDVQEDRLVLFGDLIGGEEYFEFRLKPLNTGTYQVPPVFAEGMYDSDILYRGLPASIKVHE